jgi:hypothetical protein
VTSRVIFSATSTSQIVVARRQRFARRSDPVSIALDANPHYFQVATWLLRLRFMTTQQVGRVLHPVRKPRTVYDLLRRMYDAGLITRFSTPTRKHGGRRTYSVQSIHCLDSAGAAFLAERYKASRSEIDWKPRDNQKHSFLDHRLATNDVLITMHLAAKRLGWQFEIIQSERDIHKRGGHDWVTDPQTKTRKPVKADAVCRLTLNPSGRRAWLSPEVDMGTEGEKKLKQKFRLHRRHYTSGKYQERHGTTSSRIPFIVADVRDPLLSQPMDDRQWRERLGERVLTLKRWAEEEAITQHFWFAPSFALTQGTVWQQPVWLRPGTSKPIPFIN